MTDERFDELEQELEALNPVRLSSRFQDDLRSRLEAPQTNDTELSPGNIGLGWRIGVTALTALAAVILIVLLSIWQFGEQPNPLVDRPTQETEFNRLDERPSLLAFRRAIENDNELDELLELHASKLLPHVPDPFLAGR